MINAIVQQATNDGALNASHYQTFEMAKANDTILGGDDIAQIRSYAAFARAQAQAIHKSIATMGELDDVAQAKAEMTETSQTFAKVSVYADQRIGEILRELPKAVNQHDANQVVGTPTSTRQAEKQAGIGHATSIDLQKMAANPEVVEAVIAKAEEEGKVVSRSQVIKAIKEREEAEKERDAARHAEHMMHREVESMRQALAERPEPEVIEREVVREVVPEKTKQLIHKLEQDSKQHTEEYESLRHRYEGVKSELEHANATIEAGNSVNESVLNVRCLVYALEQVARQYNGIHWNREHLKEMDAATKNTLSQTMRELNSLVSSITQEIEP